MNLKKIVVKIFLEYLRLGTRLQLLKNKPQIIGITGSAGKTSTREAIYAGLKDLKKVKNCAYGNSETGVPLDILGIRIINYSIWDWIRIFLLIPVKLISNWEKFDFLIVEMGIDSPFYPKNMSYFLKILKPNIGIFLNVSTVHGNEFDRLVKNIKPESEKYEEEIKKLIANEKGKLITSLPKHGYAILNFEDLNVRKFAKQTLAKVFSFGQTVSLKPTVLIDKVSISLNKGFVANYVISGQKYEIAFPNELLGKQYASTFAGLLASAMALKLPIDKVILSLKKNYSLPPSRMSLLKGINGLHIIDSSYNSSALTVLEAIETVADFNVSNKLAILGDLREVGKGETKIHREVARMALKVFNQVVFVGPIFEKSLKTFNYSKKKVMFFNCTIHARKYVKSLVKKNSVILVKGSQNTIFLEELIKPLLDNFNDEKKLCRQSDYWMKVKTEFFNSCSEFD